MTKTQQVMVERAKANGGTLRLANPMMLAAARTIPVDVAYVLSNCLVITKEN